jgi:hypothetical protein
MMRIYDYLKKKIINFKFECLLDLQIILFDSFNLY